MQRDNNGTFDLGYHYPPIDYLVRNTVVGDQAVLTVQPGTVLGEYGVNGIKVEDNAKAHVLGTVTEPVTIAWYGDLQETWDPNHISSNSHTFFEGRDDIDDNVGGANQNELILSFVHCYRGSYKTGGHYLIRNDTSIGGHGCSRISVSHCKIVGKAIDIQDVGGRQASIRNNLFQYAMLRLGQKQTAKVFNNLFYLNAVHFNQGSGPDHWEIQDNVFLVSRPGSSSSFSNATLGHNAFVNTNIRLGGVLQPGDRTLTSLPFVTGPFGDYYIDSNSTDANVNQIFNAGSRSAVDAALFHFSTRWPNDEKDGSSTVDIGLHYPSKTTGYGDSAD